MAIEKDKPLIQISSLPEQEIEPADPEERPLGERVITTHEIGKDGKIVLSDREYCARFGLEEDFKDVRKVIEKRRAEAPKMTGVKCSACGWRGVVRGALKERTGCFYCNPRNNRDGAKLKAMSKSEEAAWRADVKAAAERTRPAREAAMKARAMANQAELSKLK